MRVLSLFSGIGLLDLGLEWAGFRTVGLCEIEPACRWWLEQHWPGVPLWRDVREVTGAEVAEKCGQVDIVAGGFPCQPHSVAGRRKGREDERHLWPEFARIVREVRPTWVLAENVPGLRTTAADEVLSDLDAAGYSCWPLVVGADDVGAPHRRKRVWIVARLRLADSEGCRRASEGDRRERGPRPGCDGSEGHAVANAHREQRPAACGRSDSGPDGGHDAGRRGSEAGGPVGEPTGPGLALRRERAESAREAHPEHPRAGDPTLLRGWPARPGEQQREWEAPRLAEPGLGSAVDGSARRLARQRSAARRARLKALGNGVVPQVVAEVGRAILAAEALTKERREA